MTTLNDVMAIEGEAESPEEYYTAIQRSINGGVAWKFQGYVGRRMMEAIEQGYCLLGTSRATDYWGNKIPARTDVEKNTKGSVGYVVLHRGRDWADKMEAL
jgi:hypothetical protein